MATEVTNKTEWKSPPGWEAAMTLKVDLMPRKDSVAPWVGRVETTTREISSAIDTLLRNSYKAIAVPEGDLSERGDSAEQKLRIFIDPRIDHIERLKPSYLKDLEKGLANVVAKQFHNRVERVDVRADLTKRFLKMREQNGWENRMDDDDTAERGYVNGGSRTMLPTIAGNGTGTTVVLPAAATAIDQRRLEESVEHKVQNEFYQRDINKLQEDLAKKTEEYQEKKAEYEKLKSDSDHAKTLSTIRFGFASVLGLAALLWGLHNYQALGDANDKVADYQSVRTALVESQDNLRVANDKIVTWKAYEESWDETHAQAKATIEKLNDDVASYATQLNIQVERAKVPKRPSRSSFLDPDRP